LSYLKSSVRIIVKTVLVLLFFSTFLNGQDLTEETSPSNTTFVMEKSPWGAVLRSAVLPGFGQFYNESYWKIQLALYLFLGGFIIIIFIKTTKICLLILEIIFISAIEIFTGIREITSLFIS